MRTTVAAGFVVCVGTSAAVATSHFAGPPAGATALAVVLILLRERLGRFAVRRLRFQLDMLVAIGLMLFAVAIGAHVADLVQG